MDSSDNPILTPLQSEFLTAFFGQSPDFFLTGGTALSAFYLQHRLSQDLDLFTLSDEAMNLCVPAVHAAAGSIGASVSALQTTTYMRRFLMTRREDSVLVDCVREYAEQIEADKPHFGGIVVDSIVDIHCNKICTLLSRLEMKDYVDIFFLARAGFDVPSYLDRAARKDGGISAAMLAHLISEAKLQIIPDYVLKPVTIEELREFFSALSSELAVLAFPNASEAHLESTA